MPTMPATDSRVLVVEDNAFTRTTLCGALRDAGVDVVGETGSAAEAIRLGRTVMPEAALLDLDLGEGPNGADVAVELRTLAPAIGIVILTSYEDPRLTGRNLDHLPSNIVYLVKGNLDDARTLSTAIADAIDLASSETSAGPSAVPAPTGDVARLTDRQIEVIRLVAEGLSNAEIARQRDIGRADHHARRARARHSDGVLEQPARAADARVPAHERHGHRRCLRLQPSASGSADAGRSPSRAGWC
jgi:DNA-binding NarL/FixJ family response regulator